MLPGKVVWGENYQAVKRLNLIFIERGKTLHTLMHRMIKKTPQYWQLIYLIKVVPDKICQRILEQGKHRAAMERTRQTEGQW